MSKKSKDKSNNKHKKKTIFSVYVVRVLIFLAISLTLTVSAILIASPYATKLVNMVETSFSMRISDITLNKEFEPLSDKGNIPDIEKIPYGRMLGKISCEEIGLEEDVFFGVTRVSMREGLGLSDKYTLFGQEGITYLSGYEQMCFWNLDKLKAGSTFVVTTKYGEYTYKVYDVVYKSENDDFLLNATGDNLIICSICSDFHSHSGERLYVYAKCEGEV